MKHHSSAVRVIQERHDSLPLIRCSPDKVMAIIGGSTSSCGGEGEAGINLMFMLGVESKVSYGSPRYGHATFRQSVGETVGRSSGAFEELTILLAKLQPTKAWVSTPTRG